MVGFGNTAGLADFRHYAVGSRSIGALALRRATEIVDQHFGAVPGEQQRMGTPEAATGAGDNHDFIFETHRFIHRGNSSRPRDIAPSVRHGALGHNEQGCG